MNENPTSLRKRHPGEEGVALIAVLCFLVTAGVLTGLIASVAARTNSTAESHLDRLRSQYVAEGAANRIRFLIEADRSAFSVSTSTKAEEIDFDEYDFDRYLADTTEHEIDYHGIPVRFVISSAVAGVPISAGSSLSFLKTNRSEEDEDGRLTDRIQTLANRLDDLIDGDEDPLDDSFDTKDYAEWPLADFPRNAAFQFREELLWIPGITDALPLDEDGRLSIMRLPEVTSTANPSIYTVNFMLLRTLGGLEEEEAVEVLHALRVWRREKTTLQDQLEEELYAKITKNFTWTEPDTYTVKILQTAPRDHVSTRLIFTFTSDGVGGPSDQIAQFLEYHTY